MTLSSNTTTTDSAPVLEIRLFGVFTATLNGVPIPPLRTRKGAWLLALLVLKHDRPVDRSWLASVLWPDSDHRESLKNLRNTLSDLRRALGSQQFRIQSPTPGTLRFDPANAQVDITAFDTLMKLGTRQGITDAVEMYRGFLMEGCEEEWVVLEREQRQQTFLGALETLADFELGSGESAAAVRRLRLCIGIDAFRETAQCSLMSALAVCGDYAGVTQAYREFRFLLHDQLQVQPAAETVALYQTIRVRARQTAAGGAARPLRGLSQLPIARGGGSSTVDNQDLSVHISENHNLPPSLTSFVGREKELSEVQELLATTRLLTLTGTGGSGKTRLSLEVAGSFVANCLSEVWIVELAAISDPALVERTVATKLNIREQPGETLLQTVVSSLRHKTLLLVLDNCEHLVSSCGQLSAALLRGCPSVRIIATSRERLGIAGEQIYLVPPLSVPDLNASLSADHLHKFESVRLFVARACLTRPEFRMTPKNAPAVANICCRLDGLPLAIELAAARVRSLSVDELQQRLDDRFDLLTGGDRTGLPRQQTLRNLFDWSYELLTTQEKVMLQQLSVFAGGWTLEAAEQVSACNTQYRIPNTEYRIRNTEYQGEVLDLLTSLVDKSLMVAEVREGSVRYSMLETISRYCLEHLIESGRREELQSRHLAYFVKLAEDVEPKLTSAEQPVLLKLLEAEHENLRRALVWSLLEPKSTDCLRLCGALSRFWWTRGYLSEGLEWCVRALSAQGCDYHGLERAKALNGAGGLACFQGDYDSARGYLEEGLAIERELNNQIGIAISLNGLGNVAWYQNDLVSSLEYYQESLELYRQSGDRKGISASLSNLGMVSSSQGDYSSAQAFYEESLTIFIDTGNRSGTAQSLNNLGNVAYYLGNYAVARARYEESLTVRKEIGDRWGIAQSLNNLGNVVNTQGDHQSAFTYCEESLAICREIGDRKGVADSLNNLGQVAHSLGDYIKAAEYSIQCLTIRRDLGDRKGIAHSLEVFAAFAETEGNRERAVALWRAAESLRESMGYPYPSNGPYDGKRQLDELRNAMVEDTFSAAYMKGGEMTLDEAIALALRSASS